MRQALRFSLTFLLLLSLATVLEAEKRGLLPQDFYREVAVSDVAVSPGGDLAAFTVMTILEKDNKRHREIWMQRIAEGKPDGGPFRFTAPTEESSSPRWSPDGSVLSFQSRRGDDENNTWFIRIAAPGGEAYHIDGVEAAPVWSPDGKWIAYTFAPKKDNGEEEKKEKGNKREGWIASDAISKTLDIERFDGRVVTSLRYKRDGTLTLRPDPSIREKKEVYIVAAEGGEPRKLTTLDFEPQGLEWSPDGNTLYFSGDELEDEELNKEYTTDIYALSPEGGEPRKLTTNPGTERSPTISPDGNWMAFIHSMERGSETDIMIVELDPDGNFKGAPRNLTGKWGLRPGSLHWRPDGEAIRFGAGISGNSHLFEVPVKGGRVQQVTHGARQLRSISTSEDGTTMAFTVTDAVTPTELYVARGDGSAEHRASSFNDSWMADIELVPPETLTWKVKDGTEVEGWLVKPVGYDPAKKYPMVLKIHGGPHGAYGNTFFRTFHILSSAGFFVLYPNPRGSSGYGHEFMYATRGKWGEMDQEDYLAGVDTALTKYADIDPSRIGVSGGSYGGYMTNWLSATTDRFAAAVTSRSIVNWESWWGTSDAQGLTEHEFYGTPWEQRELYRRLSPISHVENVNTPTLIIHSENDYRTPIGDGEQWFMSLKKRGIPVELVRYPRSSHGLSRTGEPWLLVDRLERLKSWFVHWLIENPQEQTTDAN